MKFSTVVLIALVIAVPIHADVPTYWSIAENQLDIEEGGRVNSIAIDPELTNERFVASDSGGLFKSMDGGLHWQHVKSLPVIFTQSVRYLLPSRSSAPNVVLVSAKADFKVKNGGGVWRSTDGGQIWTQTLSYEQPDHRLSAYEISVQPGTGVVFVGTSRGLFRSVDGGVSWHEAFVAGDPTIISVLAVQDRVYLGGPSGVRMLVGNTTVPVHNIGTVLDMHAFGAWRGTNKVFYVNSAGHLYWTPVLGGGWERLHSAPLAGRCNGVPFIKVVQRVFDVQDNLYLYLSNRCDLFLLVVPVAEPMLFPGTWQRVDVDKGGPRDLAWAAAGEEPVLLGTTVGLHNRPNFLSFWRLVGGGREGGYNALQINEIKGQRVGPQRPDLYIGTRDNGIMAWSTLLTDVRIVGSEGHFIEVQRDVQTDDCNLTFEVGRKTFKSAARLPNDPPPLFPDHVNRREAPVLLEPRRFIQAVSRIGLGWARGMAQADNCTQPNRLFAVFREAPVGLARLGNNTADETNLTVVYQPYRIAGDVLKLMRLERFPFTDSAEARFPPMSYFGTLGINPHMSDLYPVYGVDPVTPSRIIAPNVGSSEKIMFSDDGGGEWFDLGDLTVLVKGGVPPKRLFHSDLNEPVGRPFPLVTAVSFSPHDPSLVLVGTSEGGIYASNGNGAPGTWVPVPDSGGATYVTSFFWENANTVYVSTFGRGLWKLTNRRISADGPALCPGCDVVSAGSGPRPPFDRGALIFGGEVLGVRTDNQKVREVLVTPGSSVVFIGDEKDLQEDIAITESGGGDTSKFEPLPEGPDGWIAAGVVFSSEDELTGAAYVESELSFFEQQHVEMPKDSTDSPTEGQPYVYLSSSSYEPQETIELSATDFTAGKSYEVLVDGVPLKGTVTAGADGSFTTRITAPSQTGYHRLAVRMAGDATVIDASMFLVRY